MRRQRTVGMLKECELCFDMPMTYSPSLSVDSWQSPYSPVLPYRSLRVEEDTGGLRCSQTHIYISVPKGQKANKDDASELCCSRFLFGTLVSTSVRTMDQISTQMARRSCSDVRWSIVKGSYQLSWQPKSSNSKFKNWCAGTERRHLPTPPGFLCPFPWGFQTPYCINDTLLTWRSSITLIVVQGTQSVVPSETDQGGKTLQELRQGLLS